MTLGTEVAGALVTILAVVKGWSLVAGLIERD